MPVRKSGRTVSSGIGTRLHDSIDLQNVKGKEWAASTCTGDACGTAGAAAYWQNLSHACRDQEVRTRGIRLGKRVAEAAVVTGVVAIG